MVLKAPISGDGKLLKISVLGDRALTLLQQFVVRYEMTTRCIVIAYRNQPTESDGRFSGSLVEQPQLLGPLQQHLDR